MEKLKLLNKIKELYKNNVNIIEYLKSLTSEKSNDLETILISYDFQAGSYTKNAEINSSYIDKYTSCLANVIGNLGKFNSIIEVGVGEATTLGNLLKKIPKNINSYGFDISWSRIYYAIQYLKKLQISEFNLFTGDLFNCPVLDNSIDVVYTSHSIEPNGGKEKEALTELYRICSEYLILLEPAFDFASDEGKARMIKNGYITKLYQAAKELKYNIVEHRLFDIYSNPLNPTGLTIIKKDNKTNCKIENIFACPVTKTPLIKYRDSYYSKESLLAYPIIKEIPCLLSQNAIISTHFLDSF